VGTKQEGVTTTESGVMTDDRLR